MERKPKGWTEQHSHYNHVRVRRNASHGDLFSSILRSLNTHGTAVYAPRDTIVLFSDIQRERMLLRDTHEVIVVVADITGKTQIITIKRINALGYKNAYMHGNA